MSYPVARRLVGLSLVLGLSISLPSWSQCSERTPAIPVPSELWGVFEPIDVGPLPSWRDTTDYDGFQFPNSDYPFFRDVDVVDDSFLFVTGPFGFLVVDVSTDELKRNPLLLASLDGWRGDYLEWPNPGENRYVQIDGAARATTNDKILIFNGGRRGVAIWEFDKVTKDRPKILYQEYYKTLVGFEQSEMVEINGRVYAYVSGPQGIQVYDATAAQAYSGCLSNGGGCPDVRIGSAGMQSTAGHLSAEGSYLAVSDISFGNGKVTVWNTATGVNSPKLVGSFSALTVTAVALWEHGGTWGLATKQETDLKVFDVTACLARGQCRGFPGAPVYQQALPDGGTERLQVSTSGGATYLYLTSETGCGGRDEKEQLFNVSSLSNIHDILPMDTVTITDGDTSSTVSYSSYYYPFNEATGPRGFVPFGGKFAGSVFFRAANSLLDGHELKALTAQVSVSGPTEVFRDDINVFAATAQFCDAETGVWTLEATPTRALSGAGASQSISWSDLGTKTITATNSACLDEAGAPAVGRLDVEVKAPEPVIVDVLLDGQILGPSGSALQVCESAEFSAIITGKPDPGDTTVDHLWTIEKLVPAELIETVGIPSFSWDSSVRDGKALPEKLQVRLDLSNILGADSVSRPLTILDRDPLGFDGDQGACPDDTVPCAVQDPPTTGQMVLFANSKGANRWQWQYRKKGDTPWIPYRALDQGQPTENLELPEVGTWEIQITIENTCQPGQQEVHVLEVEVEVIEVLMADFTPVCFGGPNNCRFDVGTSIPFSDNTTGDVALYYLNWTYSGQDEATCLNGVGGGQATFPSSHTFNSAGTFNPCVLAESSSGATDGYLFKPGIIIDPRNDPPPPRASIRVNCPAAALTGAQISCSAVATNCSPASTSWIWSTSGATVTGDTNRFSINLTWTNAGPKTVRVSNASCGSASGSDSVSVTAPSSSVTAGFGIAESCPLGGCHRPVGSSVDYIDFSEGGPDLYRYNPYNLSSAVCVLTGPSIIESGSPVNSFLFPDEGVFHPCLEVVKGADFDQFIQAQPLTIDPPVFQLEVMCDEGQLFTGESTLCSAAATGCEPLANGWSWQVPGGSFDGASSTASVLLSWTTAGPKTIEVTNSACGEAKATTEVEVEVLPLGADFAILAGPPQVGSSTTLSATPFDGASYVWTIDDLPIGSAQRIGEVPLPLVATGQTIEVDFPAIGDYNIQLTVTRGQDEATTSTVLGVLGPCVPDQTTHCFQKRRFGVSVDWQTPEGSNGPGLVSSDFSDDSGLFYFFSPSNVELLVKVLDGCDITGAHWAFLAAATGLEYRLTVTDMIAGQSMTYLNEQGTAAMAVTDTKALETCDITQLAGLRTATWQPAEAKVGIDSESRGVSRGAVAQRTRQVADLVAPAGGIGAYGGADQLAGVTASGTGTTACVPTSTTLCALGGRFEVEIEFNAPSGASGLAQRTPFQTDESAVFTFFNPSNWEVLVKVLNGCDITNHFWIFGAATTNVEYDLRVRDTATGAMKVYPNAQGVVSPAINDTSAFPCQ